MLASDYHYIVPLPPNPIMSLQEYYELEETPSCFGCCGLLSRIKLALCTLFEKNSSLAACQSDAKPLEIGEPFSLETKVKYLRILEKTERIVEKNLIRSLKVNNNPQLITYFTAKLDFLQIVNNMSQLIKQNGETSLIDELMLSAIRSRVKSISENDSRYIKRYFHHFRKYFDYRIETDNEIVQKLISAPKELGLRKYEPTPPIPLINPREREGNFGIFEFQVATSIGIRDAMEDQDLTRQIKGIMGQSTPLFGVFDGHGGSDCSTFVKKHLWRHLESELQKIEISSDQSIYHALQRSLILLDEDWVTRGAYRGGSTATFALIIDSALWVASVGDSRALLRKGNKAIQLSEDSDLSLEKYNEEILIRGGYVTYNDGDLRVDSTINMARAVGDSSMPSISSLPTITKYNLCELDLKENNQLIIACDGLWDCVGSQEVVDVCQSIQPGKEAEGLRNYAFILGTEDNVTVMVVQLTPLPYF